MPTTGFEPAIPTCMQLQTYALDGTATGIVELAIHGRVYITMKTAN